MKLNKYSSLIKAINSLNKRGYTLQFLYRNKGLYTNESIPYKIPKDKIVIKEYHRFSEEDREAILFALEMKNGPKGQLLLSSNEENMFEVILFMDKVKVKSSSSQYQL